jgi:hypothetical protein
MKFEEGRQMSTEERNVHGSDLPTVTESTRERAVQLAHKLGGMDYHIDKWTDLIVEFESSTAQACYEKAAQHDPILYGNMMNAEDNNASWIGCTCGWNKDGSLTEVPDAWPDHIRALAGGREAMDTLLLAKELADIAHIKSNVSDGCVCGLCEAVRSQFPLSEAVPLKPGLDNAASLGEAMERHDIDLRRQWELERRMCSVCAGTGKHASGRDCICGGVGTEIAEADGLRKEVYRLERREAEIRQLREALQGIIDIGKRDMTNSKYDGYFETARTVLAELSKEAGRP